MMTQARVSRRAAVVLVLSLCLLAAVLLIQTAQAQSQGPTGHGNSNGMMGRQQMMGPAMGRGCSNGAHIGMTAGHHGMCQGRYATQGRSTASAMSTPAATPAAESGVQDGVQVAADAVVPESFAAALAAAAPTRGRQLTLAAGCTGCHSLNPDQRAVGPTWHDLVETAAARVPGQSAAGYLYTSIVQPNAYIAPGYQSNIMVQSYGQQLSEREIADIVRYLLTLDGAQ